MKPLTKLFLSLVMIVGLGATLTSQAQIESDATIRVNIPHAFVVNNTTLPAGNYVVTVPESIDLNVLEQQRLEAGGIVAERHSIAATPMQGKSSKRTARQPD